MGGRGGSKEIHYSQERDRERVSKISLLLLLLLCFLLFLRCFVFAVCYVVERRGSGKGGNRIPDTVANRKIDD